MTTTAARNSRPLYRGLAILAVAAMTLSACTTPRDREPPSTDATSPAPATTSTTGSGSGLIAPDDGTGAQPSAGALGPGAAPVGHPLAATLPWLTGIALDEGLVVEESGERRWHGREPGEYAHITDGGYRYFGRDGSAVSCLATGACVGVAADGTVVVVSGHDGLRRVFGADGSDLGLFNADGDAVASEAGSPGSGGEGTGEGAQGQGTGEPSSVEGGESGDPEGGASEESDGEESGEPDGPTEPENTDQQDPDVTAPAAPDPDLGTALRASGVDVASLVNEMTLRQPFAGGVTGDPHLVTAGGLRYTTQAMGQFVARRGDADRHIQLEFAPMVHRTDVSIVSGAAIDTGADVITVSAAGLVTIDGRSQMPISSFDQIILADGVAVGRWPANDLGTAAVVIWWPDGSEVAIHLHPALGMTLIAAMPMTGEAEGLFGSAGLAQDLPARNGRAGGSTDNTVATWRVTDAERLFSENAAVNGLGTATEIDAGAQKVGGEWCGVLVRSQDRAACAFDVAVTGDTSFVAGHVTLAVADAAGRAPGAFADRWPALGAGVRTNAEDLPVSGHIGEAIEPGTSLAYRFEVERPGPVLLSFAAGCPAGANPPGIDQPAVRVFDGAGHAVSDRAAWCGQVSTGALEVGSYLLVAGNGIGGDPESLAAEVTLP